MDLPWSGTAALAEQINPALNQGTVGGRHGSRVGGLSHEAARERYSGGYLRDKIRGKLTRIDRLIGIEQRPPITNVAGRVTGSSSRGDRDWHWLRNWHWHRYWYRLGRSGRRQGAQGDGIIDTLGFCQSWPQPKQKG